VFQNKNTRKAEVIVKCFGYSEEHEMAKLVENMKQRVLNPIPNLLSIYHLEEVKITNAFCGSGITLKIYIEYLEKSLKEEMRKRRKHKNYFFSE
jgi:predicted transcriptional regulator